MRTSHLIAKKNKKFPGYSACSRCGGNWGWKKSAGHPTTSDEPMPKGMSKGLALFCTDCDPIVTDEERWRALDAWKLRAIEGMLKFRRETVTRKLNEVRYILNTEFVEYPRNFIPVEAG